MNHENQSGERKKTKRTVHPSIQTYEQEQIVQVALKFTGPKPDQLRSYRVCDIMSL